MCSYSWILFHTVGRVEGDLLYVHLPDAFSCYPVVDKSKYIPCSTYRSKYIYQTVQIKVNICPGVHIKVNKYHTVQIKVIIYPGVQIEVNIYDTVQIKVNIYPEVQINVNIYPAVQKM